MRLKLERKRKKEKKSGQWLLREDNRSLQNNPEALISTSMHSFTQSQAPSACLGKERNAFILITYMSSLGRLNCMCRWPRQSACNVCTTSLHLLHLTSHPAHTFWILTRMQRKSITWNIFFLKKDNTHFETMETVLKVSRLEFISCQTLVPINHIAYKSNNLI